MYRRYIKVRDQFIGFHKYEDAPEEVAFLRNRHRHLFKLEATIEVFHEDRELEFFMVQETIQKLILPFINLTDNLGSCEMIAEKVLEGLKKEYGDERIYKVEISEDGEHAGIVTYLP